MAEKERKIEKEGMIEKERLDVLHSAAEALRREPAIEREELVKEVGDALRIRGVSPAALKGIEEIEALAIWSKSYTESHASRLKTKDGRVLLEIDTPLSEAELELIDKLGLRK